MNMKRMSLLRSRLALPLLVGVGGVCALLAVREARAGFSLKVTPIPIVISDGATSTMAEVGNESDEALRVQGQGFDWSQDKDGKDVLNVSGEILIFPSILTIQPHSSRKVRIGTQGGYAANEKTFRVIFAEIPPDFTPVDGGGELVKVVAKVSVPLFVKPPGATGAIKVDSATVTKDKVHVVVRDTGNAHALVERLRIEALGEGGKALSSGETAGWYLLPGQPHPFDIDLATAGVNCAKAKQLVVTAISRESGTSSTVIDNPACATP
jgi:fimbrial chaperone protein